ncbi:pirin family protein [Corynebacterium bovis]|uniref:Pirin n=3 Tax=Corynebacterium bovis TaxID=36808 RepID=A0A8H9Y765_9CORY|nr:pirin family protein [Corynebacterium bovis]MBB3116044.1 hypothetical protein [Corynebacterium bovis DSM 20582 = CIP 54.80]QQC46983.1 pirin family protein [Corynebacterium bovis]RRO81865.1 pirin family protein [Corynebacterium bovis]RRO83517.1 pirin family protein [Corynebacterium bovis]RRO84916.1 pirin family protein [Corynebacterium bovis]
MSNPDPQPDDIVCAPGGAPDASAACPGEVPVEIITPREVPLGGPRAMTVRRTLPQRRRSLIGAWCFADHYGPDDVRASRGMDVAPHPHTGLQTVSWLFEGEITHIDSGGHRGTVRPGEVNLMTSGAGICHSETSTPGTTRLHGVQLWVALPDRVRSTTGRVFEHHAPDPVQIPGGSVLVFLGSLVGETSPVATHTPLLGAEIRLDPGAEAVLEVDATFEHGVLVDAGDVTVEGVTVPRAAVGYTGVGASRLHLANRGTDPARMLLLGGEPFDEEIIMWWNFVGRTGEEIRTFREEWQARTDRFGTVDGYVGLGGPDRNADGLSWLPAPTLPDTVLRPRRNPAPQARPDEPEPGSRTETVALRGEALRRPRTRGAE